MGTSLNGLTPASTYQGLIKTTDNAAISGTAKFLSDGLGNDSALALSTGNIGIGTTAPTAKLHVSQSDTNNTYPSTASINVSNFDGGNFGRTMGVNFSVGTGINSEITSGVYGVYTGFVSSVAGALSFVTNNGSSALAEKARITSDGYLRMAASTGGIQFNGDTAAANALDDYEEGTFTATLTPSTSGTITLSDSTSTYTKIGNQVTVKSKLVVSSVATPIGTITEIGGLPFTIQNSQSARGSFSVAILDASLGYTAATYPTQHSANVTTLLIYVNSSLIEADDEILFTATYFV